MDKDQAFAEAQSSFVDFLVRQIAATGKGAQAPFRMDAMRHTQPQRPRPEPGTQFEGTIDLGSGPLRAFAIDHSPDGTNPARAWLSETLVYEADDYGRVLKTYRRGPWTEQLVAEGVRRGWIEEVITRRIPEVGASQQVESEKAFTPLGG